MTILRFKTLDSAIEFAKKVDPDTDMGWKMDFHSDFDGHFYTLEQVTSFHRLFLGRSHYIRTWEDLIYDFLPYGQNVSDVFKTINMWNLDSSEDEQGQILALFK